MPSLDRADFDALLTDHARLIRLANELEYHLHAVGERPDDSPVTECRRAGGVLIGALRELLFRHDQEVLPALESMVRQ